MGLPTFSSHASQMLSALGMAMGRKPVFAEEKGQEEIKEKEDSQEQGDSFLHYFLSRPIMLLLLDKEDVVSI